MIRILMTTDEGQVEAGTVDLSGRKLSFEANAGHEEVMDSVKDFIIYGEGDEEITAESDPKKWFELLPRNISGSYMRCEVVE